MYVRLLNALAFYETTGLRTPTTLMPIFLYIKVKTVGANLQKTAKLQENFSIRCL